jgi:hypothetical protein
MAERGPPSPLEAASLEASSSKEQAGKETELLALNQPLPRKQEICYSDKKGYSRIRMSQVKLSNFSESLQMWSSRFHHRRLFLSTSSSIGNTKREQIVAPLLALPAPVVFIHPTISFLRTCNPLHLRDQRHTYLHLSPITLCCNRPLTNPVRYQYQLE